MGDAHEVIVDHIGQMVGGQVVAALVEHLVVENGRVDDHLAADDVVHMYVLAALYLKPHDILCALVDEAPGLLGWEGERIAHREARRGVILEVGRCLAGFLQLLRRVEGHISLPFVQQLLRVAAVDVPALRLAVRPVFPAEAHALVEVDAEPFERLEDILLGPRHEATAVGVLDAEDQFTASLPRE